VAGRGVLPAATWAALLGVGLLTFLPYASFFLGPTVALWSGNPLLGAALGLAYGVGRALPTLTALARPLALPHQALAPLRTGRRWARLATGFAVVIALLTLAPIGS
jgi:sulfite exporter TauE/SafE